MKTIKVILILINLMFLRLNFSEAQDSHIVYLSDGSSVIVHPISTISNDKMPRLPGPDWYGNDELLFGGVIALHGFRQIDMKQGKDGWLYLAMNYIDSASLYPQGVYVYKSSNGGANWGDVGGFNSSGYIGSLSMLVENRSTGNSNPDSTRIILYYTLGSNSNLDNASLEYSSWRRNGSGQYYGDASIPTSGNKYEFPSACSDGMYASTLTQIHVVVRETSNSGTQVGIRHFRSGDWGVTYSNGLLNTGYDDHFPSCAFLKTNTTFDSVYIAVERRFSGTNYGIRVLSTSEFTTTAFYSHEITSSTSGILYEKPCITIAQQEASRNKKIMVTCTKNNLPKYLSSINSGQSWVTDNNLGTQNNLIDYTWCSSDSLSAGSNNFVACKVDQNGDSISILKGVIGAMITFSNKRNSHQCASSITPVCCVYKSGATLYASLTYAGPGPANIYFNSEQLLSGISPISSNIPDNIQLYQNYPNPFNPVTKIKFSVTKPGLTTLKVYNVLGKEISILAGSNLIPGTYEVEWNASNFTSGVYFYKLETEGFADTKRMLLIK